MADLYDILLAQKLAGGGGGGGGDGSAWTLEEEGTVSIASDDVSTSSVKLKNTTLTVENDCIYLFFVERKTMELNAYNGAAQAVLTVASAGSSGAATRISGTTSAIKKILESEDSYTVNFVGNKGIYLSASLSSGHFVIYKSYVAAQTPNWGGEYTYRIYKCRIQDVI